MREDEWIKSAMRDDSVVVELLMRLNQSEAHASPPVKRSMMVVPPLEWGVRQPRSRQIQWCNMVQAKKEGESTRASPTTPLSWSVGTSFSGGGTGDGYEESSRPSKRPNSRSEVIATSEATNRRSRKKKSFAELKEEESLLSKETLHLKKEIATLHITHEEQKARNEGLKRIKIQLAKKTVPSSDATNEGNCTHLHHTRAVPADQISMNLPTSGKGDNADAVVCASDPCGEQKVATAALNDFFMLPDLNLPFEDDSSSEILYGMS